MKKLSVFAMSTLLLALGSVSALGQQRHGPGPAGPNRPAPTPRPQASLTLSGQLSGQTDLTSVKGDVAKYAAVNRGFFHLEVANANAPTPGPGPRPGPFPPRPKVVVDLVNPATFEVTGNVATLKGDGKLNGVAAVIEVVVTDNNRGPSNVLDTVKVTATSATGTVYTASGNLLRGDARIIVPPPPPTGVSSAQGRGVIDLSPNVGRFEVSAFSRTLTNPTNNQTVIRLSGALQYVEHAVVTTPTPTVPRPLPVIQVFSQKLTKFDVSASGNSVQLTYEVRGFKPSTTSNGAFSGIAVVTLTDDAVNGDTFKIEVFDSNNASLYAASGAVAAPGGVVIK